MVKTIQKKNSRLILDKSAQNPYGDPLVGWFHPFPALRADEDAILSNDDGSWLQCYMEDGKGRAVVSCVGNWILKTGKYMEIW